MEVIPNVHLIRDGFVNMYLIAEADGLTLIDAGMGRDGRKVLTVLAEMRRPPHHLRRILITHCDGDHVGGVAALKVATGARVYASQIEAEAMASGRSSREIGGAGPAGKLFGLVSGLFKFRPAEADEYVTDGQVLRVLGGLRVVSTPGHTPGHMSFFLPADGVLFGGDSMTSSGNLLRVSRGPTTWDEARAVESARAQAVLGARIVCVGHGPVVMEAASKFPQ
jgi:glyoxylase-like metal-dependent hydrolase (beta-lactamase superfamily II)